MALRDDLVHSLLTLEEARDLAASSLAYVASLPSSDVAIAGSSLVLRTVEQDGAMVPLRPLNTSLFIAERPSYLDAFAEFAEVLVELEAAHGNLPEARKESRPREPSRRSRALHDDAGNRLRDGLPSHGANRA